LINVEKPFVYLLGIESNYQTGEKAKVDFYLQQLDKMDLTDTEKKEVLYWRARVALDINNTETAKTYLDSLGEIDKYYPQYHLLLGVVKMKEGDVEGARESFQRSIEYDLNNEITEEAGKHLTQ